MTRRADLHRIFQAWRSAIRNGLTDYGMEPAEAERWCDAWETEAALRDLKRDGDYWEGGKDWIDVQCAARNRPPN